MHAKNRTARALALTASAALALAAGTASALASSGPSTQASSPSVSPQRAKQVAQTAARSLIMQPGDERIFASASTRPLVFTAIEKQRQFTGELIVHARKGASARPAVRRVSPLIVKSSALVDEHVVRVPQGMTEGELAALLMATGDYEFVEPNWLLAPAVIPNDSQYSNSWQHNRLQSAAAWDLHTGGSDVIVAVCDSGVDLDHPDLQDALVPGYNAASGRPQATGGDVEDINGHGTFVAGCAAAQGDNGRGVVGVGWDFGVMPIRVTNRTDGNASAFNILDGARWAAENGAQIINASFSGGTSGANQTAAVYIKSQGGLLFWASGNDNAYVSPNRPDYVMVGSTTSSDNRSGFSNYGPAVDVTAPGSGVRSTRRGGSYGNSSGTSYACPIAAGVGAMIFSVNTDFSPDDVQAILYASVDDLGATGRDDNFGRGRVNTLSAIQHAQSYVRPLAAPLSQDFQDNSWRDLLFASSGAIETTTPDGAPADASVLRIDASDIAQSVALAGRSLPGDGILSFSLQASGIEDAEELLVQYLENPETSPADTWTTLAAITGRGLTAQQPVRYDIALPNEYEWHGVAIRFLAQGDDASDAWLLDDLSIALPADPVAPLVENFETDSFSPVRWSTINAPETVLEDDNFFASLSDGDGLESTAIPLDQFGIVPAYIRLSAWVDAAAASSDTLTVEARNISNAWETVEVIHAADLSGSPQLISLDVPLTAIAIPNMALRLTASTAGAFMIDDVYVGVEELSLGCSAADLAEPFGDLNFFDVSAFLNAFNSADPSADINNDGDYNFFDISAYLNVFNAGCP